MPATTQTLQKGRFSIEQELFSNGTCTHFQAYDTEGEEAVSIFEIVPRLPKVATISQRDSLEAAFTAKARTVSLLKQKALPNVLSSFIDGGRYYVVTECVGGTDLLSIAKDREEAFPTSQLAEWADSLLEALAALHYSRPSIVYRNLHPQNLVLGPEGAVTLSVSGLFHSSDPDPAASKNSASGGSAIAFSPLEQIWSGLDAASQKVIINQYDEASERVLKQELDARSDIYSLGATLYFLATGRTPVDALERSIEMIDGNLDPLVSPNKLNPSVPTEVSDVIMKAMEIRREYRFDSAAIMRQVLRTALVRIKERGADISAPVSNAAAPGIHTEPVRNGHVKKDPNDEVAKRLREAEEKRHEAERRAAEAEKKLREAEEAQARITESFNLTQLGDDVLGLLDPTPTQAAEASEIEFPAAGTSSIETQFEQEKDVSSTVGHPSETVEVETSETTGQVYREISEASDLPLPEANANAEEPVRELDTFGLPSSSVRDDDVEFSFESETSRSKSPFPFGVPVITAAAAVLFIAAIGGWLVFRGGTPPDAATTLQAQPAASQENQPEQPVQSAYQTDETSQPPGSEVSTELSPGADQQTITQPDRTAPSKTKKAAPAKTPAPKKAVTVDDLINDN